MGAQWISNQKSSSIICWVPFLQLNTGFGYFPLAGEVFWKFIFLICVVQEFCFFVFEFLHNTCITSQEHRSKINTLETKDFFWSVSDLCHVFGSWCLYWYPDWEVCLIYFSFLSPAKETWNDDEWWWLWIHCFSFKMVLALSLAIKFQKLDFFC